jgi:enolase
MIGMDGKLPTEAVGEDSIGRGRSVCHQHQILKEGIDLRRELILIKVNQIGTLTETTECIRWRRTRR